MPYEPVEIFHCTNCGECCRGYGGTAVSENDLERISAFTGIDLAQLKSNYCQVSGGKWMIAQGDNTYCVFWDNGCRIHPVKPAMCKAWPFIEGVLKDIENWQIMAGECPGMRMDIPDKDILNCVRRSLNKAR